MIQQSVHIIFVFIWWIIRPFIKRIVHILEIDQSNVQVTSEEIYSHLSETGPVIVLTNANQLHCRWYIIYSQVTYWRDQRCFLDSGFDQKGTKWRILIWFLSNPRLILALPCQSLRQSVTALVEFAPDEFMQPLQKSRKLSLWYPSSTRSKAVWRS